MNGNLFPALRDLPAEMPDERYTTRETLDLCKRLAGVDAFDLDVAACEESHHAPHWFSINDDGLKRKWGLPGARIWCNPPYSEIRPWVEKAWKEAWREGRTIAMLVPAWTDRAWWQELIEPHRDRGPFLGPPETESFRGRLQTHFLPRVSFGHQGNPNGLNCGTPPFWCVLLVWTSAGRLIP